MKTGSIDLVSLAQRRFRLFSQENRARQRRVLAGGWFESHVK
jgi:hypothetical protein